ncbi:2,3-bisphosphoglycerate-independent phosphoglycerate mutase [Chitinimonas sp. BJB300]|uniref:2,3-bisphosphoglycerate-independent phosphoglycerate mutase n=1 Tax=Chitinimonas sp. BJB300 TaxID=1559339 RepID=UPI000C0F8423|nr:2,3-bisphosphoglycerate-independent phosphoglycerate mutase [Chitinimonas sp. BJB300]PHV11670.1 phosphoglycerate mutase (2,3-diphosphoglycerate-independent) [Chitinimonas sp. BJB300]TSJ85923.1 2,3-bisphosphoglycerate-independent phosphoglycerate mutase [Chitinimonas sp. BJB300]
MTTVTPVLLLILDGYGHRLEGADNAILHAQKPHIDSLMAEFPHTTINASEQFVGLPAGQFGNSEVGHLNIGAGRVLQQDISRVDCDVADQSLGSNPVLKQAIDTAAAAKTTLHILGLVSDGGVHAHESHIHELIRAAHQAGVAKIAVHAFLDGRDTPPRSAERYLGRLQTVCDANPGAQIVSVVGRYYVMDRDKRWERVEPAYRLIVDGEAEYVAVTAQEALAAAYARGENDEFVLATAIRPHGNPSRIEDGDVVVFMNFRADRAREITVAINEDSFDGFARPRRPKLAVFATLTSYAEIYPYPVAYTKPKVQNSFGEYIGRLGLKQLRIAETEKYPHVTYFFSGGEEKEFPGEDRILVASPKVATYDLKPEMSAVEVTDKIVEAIESKQYAAIICNYANGDMVGHTGNFDAAVKAIEALDACVGRAVAAMQAIGGEVIITADHGNCEVMWDNVSGQAHTQHTTDLVPFIYIGRKARLASSGALKDIAPSLLAMMGISQPAEMTGHSLIHFA